MKRLGLIAAVFGALLVSAESAAASPPPLQSVCKNQSGGYPTETSDGQWGESAPYMISISRATVLSINRRVRRFRRRAGTHPRYVPCRVARAVALNGMQAFDETTGSDAWTGVSWQGASSGPWFGRFHCTWYDKFGDGQTWATTCTHSADRHAGRIVVQFIIQGQEIGLPPS